jgi:hypothetical protein
VPALSKECSQRRSFFSKLRCHQDVSVAGLRLQFSIVRVQHSRLVLHIGSGELEWRWGSAAVSEAWARSCEEREKGSGGRQSSIYSHKTSGGNKVSRRHLQSHMQSTKLVSKWGLKFTFLGFNPSNHSPLYSGS